MMDKKRIMVIAPHADDETIGCGGSLLRWKDEGAEIDLVLVTEPTDNSQYLEAYLSARRKAIDTVSQTLNVTKLFEGGFPTCALDSLPFNDVMDWMSEIMHERHPSLVLLPFRFDAHSDHRVVFDAGIACTKSFRYPSIEKVLCYETISETDQNYRPDSSAFRPNYFVNISDYIDKKVELVEAYASELGHHPFPRSFESIRALAKVRGAASNFNSAEAFMIVKERVL